ncbi:MAG: phage virion morphogenesis protein [Siculibacillus sp.]
MAGVSILASIDDKQVRAGLAKLAGAPRRALAPIGMALVKGTQRRFRAGVGPDGAAWKKLLPAYAAIKRGPGILRASSALMNSVSSRVGADEVRAGTNRIYARVHQFGATIVPKKARFLRFRLAGGFVLASKVTIPGRSFMGIDAEDEQEIGDVLEALLLGR